MTTSTTPDPSLERLTIDDQLPPDTDVVCNDNTHQQYVTTILPSSDPVTVCDHSSSDDGDESTPGDVGCFDIANASLNLDINAFIADCTRTLGVELSDEARENLIAEYEEKKAAGEQDNETIVARERDTLRAKLHGHWYDDDSRSCSFCIKRATYVHGPFRNTAFDYSSLNLISLEDVCSQAQPMSKGIWDDYEKLKTIIERYEIIIQKRWAKKAISKRKQFLQSAWATTSSPPPQPMPQTHLPEVAYLSSRCNPRKGICNCSKFENEKRHIFLWPRMNIEDLTKFEPLLLLLNARGRHSPSLFAIADLSGAHFGWKTNQLRHPPYLDMYSMIFTGQESPTEYGRLVSWADDPSAYNRMYMGRDLSPGEGLVVLEIQHRLYRFLVNICQSILFDHQVEDHSHLLAQPVAPEPSLPTANSLQQDMSTSLMITRYETAYHLPAKLDVRRLQLLVESKLAEAEDTLWALREDPNFFSRTLAAMHQSRPEHIRDTLNRRHRSVETPGAQHKLMNHIIGMIWRQYISAIEIWEQLHDKVSRLGDLKEQLFDNAQVPIRPEDDLPEELAMAIYSVWFHFNKRLAERLTNLPVRVYSLPNLRHLYRRQLCCQFKQFPPDFIDEEVGLVPSGVIASQELEAFQWLINRISNPSHRRRFGIHNAVEALEGIVSDRKVHKLLSSVRAAELSDYTIISECVRQLELFEPWAATFEAGMANLDTARMLESEYEVSVSKSGPLAEWKPSEETCALGAKLWDIRYPVDKAPTKGNIDAMREAERLLDGFWEAALQEFEHSGLMTKRLSKVLHGNTPERTPVWVAPLKTETRTAKHCDNDLAAYSFTGGVHDAHDLPVRVKPAEPRVKIKSRGVASTPTTKPEPVKPNQQEDGPEQPLDVVSTCIEVDRRALKVAEMLFHKTSPGFSKGEVAWSEFNYLMHYAGFSVEKLGGSSWQFTPISSNLIERGYRGIQFHEPHPKAKLAFVVARQYGRRLARTYGWSAEIFRLQMS